MSRYPRWWLRDPNCPQEYIEDWAESRAYDRDADDDTDARLSDEPDRGAGAH